MNKDQIEKRIFKECESVILELKGVPFDKGLQLLQAKAWQIADKYDTDGANVVNIILKRFSDLNEG